LNSLLTRNIRKSAWKSTFTQVNPLKRLDPSPRALCYSASVKCEFEPFCCRAHNIIS